MISPNDKIIDYCIPQRQATVGMIIEMLVAFKEILQKLWPFLLILIVQVKKTGLMTPSLTILALLPLMIVIGYLNYRNFLFYIDEEKEEFILKKGIFNKKIIAVRFSRIQQVNINQSFIKRLFNVYEVEIETAGSSKDEARIRAVSKRTALYLRDRLLSGKIPKVEGEHGKVNSLNNASEIPEVSRIRISLGSLVKIAVTSNYLRSLVLIFAFLTTGYNRLKESIFKDDDLENKFAEYLSTLNFSQYILIISFTLILIVFVFNLLRYIIVYFDFTIRRQGQSLQFSYGLINTKNTIIQSSKVQKVRLVTNIFQRKMNLARMFISQASSDIVKDKKATIQLPGFNKEEGKEILQFLFDAQPVKGFMVKPNIRRVLASVNKFILLPVIIALIASWILEVWMPLLIGFPIYLIVISFLIYISYLNNRLFVHEDFIIKKSGIWDVSTEIIEPFKIQAVTTQQYLWHVKSNVGHVTLHTAGGNLEFKFGDFSTIKRYADYWLYQVETSDKEWM